MDGSCSFLAKNQNHDLFPPHVTPLMEQGLSKGNAHIWAPLASLQYTAVLAALTEGQNGGSPPHPATPRGLCPEKKVPWSVDYGLQKMERAGQSPGRAWEFTPQLSRGWRYTTLTAPELSGGTASPGPVCLPHSLTAQHHVLPQIHVSYSSLLLLSYNP